MPTAPQPTGSLLSKSFKGCELYTWETDGVTWFTLLPGTNRNKTPTEVFSEERDSVDGDGWYAITFVGLDKLGGQLARLPSGESVIVFAVRFPAGADLEVIETPAQVSQALHQYAVSLGLDLGP